MCSPSSQGKKAGSPARRKTAQKGLQGLDGTIEHRQNRVNDPFPMSRAIRFTASNIDFINEEANGWGLWSAFASSLLAKWRTRARRGRSWGRAESGETKKNMGLGGRRQEMTNAHGLT